MSFETYVCDHCRKQFVGHKRNGRWHFCNIDCLTEARKLGGAIALQRMKTIYERQCSLPSCGKTFQYVKHNKRKQYCDRKCAGLARRAGGLIAEKVENTTMKNHGVSRFFCDRERFRQAMQEKHGVDNVSQIPGLRKESWKKAHATKRLNGTYKASKIERAVVDALSLECAVETQVIVFGKPIDVVVSLPEKIHVQIDGRYWHGLDRPLDDIRNSSSPRDVNIVKRWESDRRQDEQFAQSGLKLIRITDSEAKEWLRNKQKLLPLLMERAEAKMTSMN